ncbi:MAG TPA: hypothetical protein VK501_23435 [Baekduia sp.]|uniref:hypothetical protein n=1 Tax=Baekduia sp. TaxID=2600305 RepID=UPI002D120825|nr:hypothetical protein [Baekduia sp.]HMJ36878.1 hypothetical protein [Baekduia sp.]
MPDRTRSLAAPLIALAVVALVVLATRPRGAASTAQQGRQVGRVTATERAATFAFDPAAAPADRDAVLLAVSHARPEAQRLIAAIDGIVDVHVASTAAGIAGTTQSVGPRYSVTLNLAVVSRRYGQRGIDRTVLHELGHVVDFALVDSALHRRLDAAIPTGYGCDEQQMGGCADTRERFAESFAKWATRDIGVDLYLGYKVPPPDDLESWGAPLASVAVG